MIICEDVEIESEVLGVFDHKQGPVILNWQQMVISKLHGQKKYTRNNHVTVTHVV